MQGGLVEEQVCFQYSLNDENLQCREEQNLMILRYSGAMPRSVLYITL